MEQEKAVSERSARREGEAPKSGRVKSKAGERTAGDSDSEVYRLVIRSIPVSAEVLIDGEYFSRTPCERRILDPTKSFAITVRKEGYEQHERLVGPSDDWAKKGGERLLNMTVVLKRAKPGEARAATAFGPEEDSTPKSGIAGVKSEPAPSGSGGAVLPGRGSAGSTAAEATAKGGAVGDSRPAKPEEQRPALPPTKPPPSLDDQDKPKE
jgi:hypothetical protein